MSGSKIFVKTLCVSLVLVSLVMIPGCTTTPSGPDGTIPVISPFSTMVSPVSSPSLNPEQPGPGIRIPGNIYGLSSNPQVGIDTIMFTISPTPQAQAIDLTRLQIVFSTPDTATVVLTRGTTDTTRTFSATMGNNPVTSVLPGDEAEIAFRVKGVPAGTRVGIELRPSSGAALSVSRTVPAMILSMNVLG